jgi:glycosyltransferase involved in cell wall biosynthesis
MIRVLHVLSSLGGGGVESMLYNYYTHLNRDEIQFDFIVHGEKVGMLEEKFLEMGSKIYHVKPKKEGLLQNLSQIKRILYSQPRYDVVHCHQNLISFVPLYFAKKAGINTRIAHSHTTFSGKGTGREFINSVFRFLLKINANQFFACSVDAAKCLFGEKKYIEDKVDIIPNAIDESFYRFNPLIRNKVRRELHIEDKFVIGHVGRFSKEKNQKFVLQIFKEIYQLNKNSVLLLIGDGELEQETKQLASSFSASKNIVFLGLRKDVNYILQAMDCFILPSLHEGFGIVLLEAQAAGLKCLASTAVPKETNVAGLVDFLELNAGSNHWAECILNYQHVYERKAQTQKFIASNYDIRQASNYLEKLYLNLFNSNTMRD